jgi:predicted transglutaminase-like cysteine proteinase
MEVWVTNRQNRVSTTDNNLRNIVALQDLGEAQLSGLEDYQVVNIGPNIPSDFFTSPSNSPVDNKNNKFNPALIQEGTGFLNSSIRQIETTSNASFNVPGASVSEGIDYAKLENARKLSPNEYTFHPQLGYISLQQRLANDEVLAVAYQYTIGGDVYQVGEFANGGPESTTVTGDQPENQVIETNSLVLKMLKSSLTTVQNTVGGVTRTRPIWNLMMKNIYQVATGGQLEQEDFRFNNEFFKCASEIEYNELSDINGQEAEQMRKAYADVEQQIPENKDKENIGKVEIKLLPDEEYTESMLAQTLEKVRELKSLGVADKDIAILESGIVISSFGYAGHGIARISAGPFHNDFTSFAFYKYVVLLSAKRIFEIIVRGKFRVDNGYDIRFLPNTIGSCNSIFLWSIEISFRTAKRINCSSRSQCKFRCKF